MLRRACHPPGLRPSPLRPLPVSQHPRHQAPRTASRTPCHPSWTPSRDWCAQKCHKEATQDALDPSVLTPTHNGGDARDKLGIAQVAHVSGPGPGRSATARAAGRGGATSRPRAACRVRTDIEPACRLRSSSLHRRRVDVPIQRGHHRRVHAHTGMPPTVVSRSARTHCRGSSPTLPVWRGRSFTEPLSAPRIAPTLLCAQDSVILAGAPHDERPLLVLPPSGAVTSRPTACAGLPPPS